MFFLAVRPSRNQQPETFPVSGLRPAHCIALLYPKNTEDRSVKCAMDGFDLDAAAFPSQGTVKGDRKRPRERIGDGAGRCYHGAGSGGDERLAKPHQGWMLVGGASGIAGREDRELRDRG
jgi:hypothetical protein